MVTLAVAQASNDRIATRLAAGMTAVFVGGTNGIGEYTLKQFAQPADKARIYLVGRSLDNANRIISECTKLNEDGAYRFIQSDVSLLKNVDKVCQQILSKEDTINLLFQTQAGMRTESEYCLARNPRLAPRLCLPFTSRILFCINLLQAIQRASGLRRFVSVFAAGYEGPFEESDWPNMASNDP